MNLNSTFGLFAGLVLFSSVSFSADIISVPAQGQSVEIETVSQVVKPIDVRPVISKLKEFYPYYSANKQAILDKEKGYLKIVEKPEEAIEDSKYNLELISEIKDWVYDLDKDMMRRIKYLDYITFKADEFCSYTNEDRYERVCIELQDNIHLYEASVSTYTAMIDVMDERYKETKEILGQ